MERIKRNPGGYGLALGGTIGIVSVLFSWVSVTNAVTDVTTSVPAHGTVSGQTLGLIGLLAVISRLGWPRPPAVGGSCGRSSQLFATTELISKLRLTGVQDSASDSIKAGSASGDLTARVAFAAIVGIAGGALGVLGALLAFGKKQPRVDD